MFWGVAFPGGAVPAGPGNRPEGIEALKNAVVGMAKESDLVLYCGCCPMDKCPKIRPAWRTLMELGYTRVGVLRIPKNMAADGYGKDYRSEAGTRSVPTIRFSASPHLTCARKGLGDEAVMWPNFRKIEHREGKKIYKWFVGDDAKSGDKLALARHHLKRVLSAWVDPTDWDDLSLYGFYCLEAAVEAAAVRVGLRTSKRHWEKADVARELHKDHGLPDIEKLLRDLNDARKSAAYGDIPAPDLNAEVVASEIETYVDAVASLVEGIADNDA